MWSLDGTKWNQQAHSRKHHGLMNANDAALCLGKTRRTVCRWEADGKMPPRVRYGGRMLYRLADIEEMAQRMKDGEGGQ